MRKDEKAHMGQTIRTDGAPDKSSYKKNQDEAFVGKKMAGGPTDVSHSLSGAGNVETYNDTGRKSRK